MQRLFIRRLNSRVGNEINEKISISKFQNVNFSFFSSFMLNIKRVLPKSCRCLCCKETTRDRMFNRGFTKFRREIEITELVKTIRTLKAVAKKNFSQI